MLHTQVQDENVLYHGALGKRKDTEKQGPFAMPLYGSSQGTVGGRPAKDGGLKTPGTHLAPRRALGDLTNATPARPGLGPIKTPAPGRTGRRALGDITNATPGTQPATAKAAPPRAQARPLEEVYAEEGVERLAGKGWSEQEEEREARQAAERAARLDVIMSSLYPSRASLLVSCSIQEANCDAKHLLLNGRH